MSKSDKLFELHSKKLKLHEEICKLDLESAKKKDEYRKIVLELHKLEGQYSRETH